VEVVFPFVTAFLAGLLGGVHCVGMCGGIVSMLSLSVPERKRTSAWDLLSFQLAYNFGRMLSYIVAGMLMGGLGFLLASFLPIYYVQKTLMVLAGSFMILLGLYLAGWWMFLRRVEILGQYLWRFIEPVARQLLPINSTSGAFKVGLFWGWVPCGLVYSILINAIATGSVWKGGLLMAMFALGTLPNLLLMGMLVGLSSRLARNIVFKRFAGGLLVLFGLYTFYGVLGYGH